MKQAKKLFAALLALALLLSLCGCGNTMRVLQQMQQENSDAGYYILSSLSVENGAYVFEGETLEAFGTVYIELKEDKTGVLFWDGGAITLTWERGTITIDKQYVEDFGMETLSYTLEDDVLSFEAEFDDMKMEFTRSDGAPPTQPSSRPTQPGTLPDGPSRPADGGDEGVFTLDNCELIYQGACLMLDSSGNLALVVTMDYTNTGSETSCYGSDAVEWASQNGEELDYANVLLNEAYDTAFDGQYEDVAPGASLEVYTAFVLNDPYDTVAFYVESMVSDKGGSITIHPADLAMEDSYVPDNSGMEYTDFSWGGDWYGWWYLSNAEGDYWTEREGEWNDCCATIEEYSDGTGYIEIWDERGDGRNQLVECSVSFGPGITPGGCMMSESGLFYGDDEIGHADWIVDSGASYFMGSSKTVSEYGNMIAIEGTYSDPEYGGSFDYVFYLKPWGEGWEDVEADRPDDIPSAYYNWYLPLIEAGESMPYIIGG